VLIQAPVGLKCQQRPGRIWPEVVAGAFKGIHRMAAGQETTVAVPQADPCLHEGGLGGLIHRAVLIQAPVGLKCQQRPGRIWPEVVAGDFKGIHRMADGQETTVEVPDGSPLVAGSDRL
jgi:hypothetical protein